MADEDTVIDNDAFLARMLDSSLTMGRKITARLLPLEAEPVYLGGLPLKGTNRVSSASPYGMLPRPLSLPPPKNFSFCSADQESVYLKMYNGDLSIEWEHDLDVLCIKASYGDQESCPRELQGDLMEVRFLTTNDDTMEPNMLSSSTEMNTEFKTRLEYSLLNPKLSSSEKQNDALAARIVHLFLRSHGALLSDHMLMTSTFHLSQVYQGRRQWQDMLDIAIVYTDSAINKNVDKLLVKVGLKQVSEILEAMEKFEEAGSVYCQVAQEYAEGADSATRFYEYAGMAFHSCQNFTEAEKNYVAALYWDSSRDAKWNLNVSPTNDIFTNVLHLYIADEVDSDVGAILAILLSHAGFCGEEGTFVGNLIESVQSQLPRTLKPKFDNERGARRALEQAVFSNNGKKFRSVVSKCKRTDVRLVPQWKDHWKRRGGPLNSREFTRQRLLRADVMHKISCAHCGAVEDKNAGNFQCCPCHSVYYCRKSCQVAHWKAEHRQVCPHRAQNKKASNGAAIGK